jgi:hypothetical protein
MTLAITTETTMTAATLHATPEFQRALSAVERQYADRLHVGLLPLTVGDIERLLVDDPSALRAWVQYRELE